jgi:hypothetical protein
VTHGSYGCEITPNKEEKHCARLTTRGDRIHYPDYVDTPTANMTLQSPAQHHHIHRKCTTWHPRPDRVLPEHTNEEVQIHAVETQRHTRGNHYLIEIV